MGQTTVPSNPIQLLPLAPKSSCGGCLVSAAIVRRGCSSSYRHSFATIDLPLQVTQHLQSSCPGVPCTCRKGTSKTIRHRDKTDSTAGTEAACGCSRHCHWRGPNKTDVHTAYNNQQCLQMCLILAKLYLHSFLSPNTEAYSQEGLHQG